MKINAIAFVGIPVTDMKCARAFYENALGLKPDPEMTGEMWTEYPIGSGTLAVSLATQTANTVFAGATSGGAATPTFNSWRTQPPRLPIGSATTCAARRSFAA